MIIVLWFVVQVKNCEIAVQCNVVILEAAVCYSINIMHSINHLAMQLPPSDLRKRFDPAWPKVLLG